MDGRVLRVLQGFQSTPPAWEETRKMHAIGDQKEFQSTPPAWEETVCVPVFARIRSISIHSSRVGGDARAGRRGPTRKRYFNPLLPRGRRQLRRAAHCAAVGFQSTPPAWEETCVGAQQLLPHGISIHSSRVGGDADIAHVIAPCRISIHSSRVGGDCKKYQIERSPVFRFAQYRC